MRLGAVKFSGEWAERVKRLPESGMGYTVVDIELRDGRVFHQVVIDSGVVTRVRGRSDIPFTESDISVITPTHERWDWKEAP